jgi:excisionase family DNA binding protein
VKENVRDEIQVALKLAQELPPEQLPRLLGELEEVRCTAKARLSAPRQVRRVEPDSLLAVGEASRRLGVSRDYLYRHSKDLPFTRRMGRRLLFSSQGIGKHIG